MFAVENQITLYVLTSYGKKLYTAFSTEHGVVFYAGNYYLGLKLFELAFTLLPVLFHLILGLLLGLL